MAKVKLGTWEVDEADLLREIEEATRRGEERMKTEPRAKSAHYDPASQRLVIELVNGCVFICPTELLQGLRGASAEDLADFKLMPRGFDLHWKRLDAQFTVAGLLNGQFGTKAWMAQLEPGRQTAAKTGAAGKTGRKSRRATVKTAGNAQARRGRKAA